MNKNWLITRAQIAAGNVDDVVHPVDPAVILNEEIYGLGGAVRLRVEGVTKPADIFADPESRKFFQRLNESWPWAGYFLRLHSVTVNSPPEQIVDMALFMSLIFCRLDELAYAESKQGVTLRFHSEQFAQQLTDLRERAAELASMTGISNTQIQKRDKLIVTSVTNFFAAGQILHQSNRRQKNPPAS